MTTDNLCLLVCEHYAREISLVAAELDGVRVVAFPARCHQPTIAQREITDRLGACTGCAATRVIGGSCIVGLINQVDDPDDVLLLELCFHVLVPPALANNYLAEGAYLLTPGWLANWPQYVASWGMDQPAARAFFSETIDNVVLFDSGIDLDAPQALEAFADFVGRPSTIVPVGLDYARRVVHELVADWQSNNFQVALDNQVRAARRQTADYAMALDLIRPLTQTSSEDAVIDSILDVFGMLFGPRQIMYYRHLDGEWSLAQNCVSAANVPPVETLLAKMTGSYVMLESGFALLLRHGDQQFGLVVCDNVDYPNYLGHYVNLALSIVDVCALAILNTRYAQEAEESAALRHEREILEIKLANERELSQLKSRFITTTSHEFRTPLTVIKSSAHLLSRYFERLNNEQREKHLYQINFQVEHMSGLLDDVLTVGRAESGDLVFNSQRLDLALFVASFVAETRLSVPRLHFVPRVSECFIKGDVRLLRQIIGNLVSNAVKYSPDGGRVTVRLSVEGDEARLSVADSGMGIPLEDQSRIFESFHRGANVGAIKGTGLGLAIVRLAVERHGGRAWFESEPDEGTTFFVALPLAR